MKLTSNPQTTKTADFPSSAHISQISQGVFIISIRKKRKKKPGQPPALGGEGNKKIPKVQRHGCCGRPFGIGVLFLPVSLQMWALEKGQGLLGPLEKVIWRSKQKDLEGIKGCLTVNSPTLLQKEDVVWQMQGQRQSTRDKSSCRREGSRSWGFSSPLFATCVRTLLRQESSLTRHVGACSGGIAHPCKGTHSSWLVWLHWE